VDFAHGQVAELMTGYGPIDILWLDAGQVRPPQQDLQMERLGAMARQHQPRLIIVDRTVGGRFENHRTPEQEVPRKPLMRILSPLAQAACAAVCSSCTLAHADCGIVAE
jgi:alpha-L-fucosidase